jgi:hypothetical protein
LKAIEEQQEECGTNKQTERSDNYLAPFRRRILESRAGACSNLCSSSGERVGTVDTCSDVLWVWTPDFHRLAFGFTRRCRCFTVCCHPLHNVVQLGVTCNVCPNSAIDKGWGMKEKEKDSYKNIAELDGCWNGAII